MMAALKELLQNPLIQLLSSFVAGLLVSVIFYRLSRRVKQPLWAITTTNLIRGFSGKLPELEIKYSGENVENLSVSKVVFWNGGRETIQDTDIAEADPLRIIGEGGVKLLSVQLVKANSAPSRFLISRSTNDDAAFLGFDFLDRKDGAVIQVIHTGASSDDIRIVGTVKGGGRPIKRNVMVFRPINRLQIASLWLVAGLSLTGVGVAFTYASLRGLKSMESPLLFTLMSLISWVFTSVIMVSAWFVVKASSFLPKGLESFRDDL